MKKAYFMLLFFSLSQLAGCQWLNSFYQWQAKSSLLVSDLAFSLEGNSAACFFLQRFNRLAKQSGLKQFDRAKYNFSAARCAAIKGQQQLASSFLRLAIDHNYPLSWQAFKSYPEFFKLSQNRQLRQLIVAKDKKDLKEYLQQLSASWQRMQKLTAGVVKLTSLLLKVVKILGYDTLLFALIFLLFLFVSSFLPLPGGATKLAAIYCSSTLFYLILAWIILGFDLVVIRGPFRFTLLIAIIAALVYLSVRFFDHLIGRIKSCFKKMAK